MTTPFSVSEYTLTGLDGYSQTTYAAHVESSASEIGAQYSALVNTISSIVTPYSSSSTVAAPLTASQQTALEQAINGLRDLLVNGYTPPGGTKQYATASMANQLDFLFQSLIAAGVSPTATTITFGSLAKAQEWQSLVAGSLVLNSLFTFVSENRNRSLQAMIELDYVATGNDLISTQLTDLQDALTITKTSLDNLTTLQTLHNKIQVTSAAAFTEGFNLEGTGLALSAFQAQYKAAASAYFGAPISISTPLFPSDPLKNYELATSVSSSVVGIDPAVIPALDSMLDNLESVNPDGAFYAKFVSYDPLENKATYNLYVLGQHFNDPYYTADSNALLASTPDVPSIQISGLPLQDTMFYWADSGPNIGPANETFRARYNMQGATAALGTPPVFTQVIITNTSATAIKFYDDLVYGRYLQQNMVPLATDTSSYFGVANTANSTVNASISRFSDIIGPTSSLPDISANAWIGYDSILKKYVTDIRDPAILYSARDSLIQVRTAIEHQIAELTLTTPKLENGDVDPHTLLAKLTVVLADLNKSFTTTGTAAGTPITASSALKDLMKGMTSWLVDNYNSTDGAIEVGAYQQNLQFAITAGQSLNDTQNESIRRFLFIFEEYYKSASAILQQITKILERLAQNLAR